MTENISYPHGSNWPLLYINNKWLLQEKSQTTTSYFTQKKQKYVYFVHSRYSSYGKKWCYFFNAYEFFFVPN